MPLATGLFKHWLGMLREYGLIRPDDGGPDVFVPQSLLRTELVMHMDERVAYEADWNSTAGAWICISCEVVPPPPPPGLPPGWRPRSTDGEPMNKHPRNNLG
jgi:cold shock CspA family protein